MLLSELGGYFESIGERAFRAEQVFRWVQQGGARSFGEMTNLSKALKEKLGGEFYITVPEMVEKQVSKLDGTIKYLWRLADGNTIETVVMEYEHGHTVCISTQVGCRMGCSFCASAIGGLVRNLAASEMLDQVMFSQLDTGKRIANIVLMGIGEPLDNFENVLRFLELINHPSGMGVGARHITLSTCGIIENIDKLAVHDVQLSLAISLHAPDDETRALLMPISKAYGVDDLLRACGRYFKTTGRRITFEYALIGGVNDTQSHAELLAKKLRNTGSHLNLILFNDVPECDFRESTPEDKKQFVNILRKNNVHFTVRRKLGSDIEASCGQLRRRRAVES